MAQNLKTGDTVMVISGIHKGKSAKIIAMDRDNNKAMLEGIGLRERHIRATQFNPKGGKRDIHLGIHVSNLRKTAAAKSTASTKSSKSAKKSTKESK